MEQIMELKKISIENIELIVGFNVRKDLGKKELIDLQESIKRTNGNIEPLIVSKKDENVYELIAGERRFIALKKAKFTEALCLVYENLSELEKTKFMLHENLGRKNLLWREEIQAIKKLKELGEPINVKTLASTNAIHEKKAWRLLKALEAVEEFPELENEKTRTQVLSKYKRLKDLTNKQVTIDSVKNAKETEEKCVEEEIKKINPNSLVIEELKQEISYYKEKLRSVDEDIKKMTQQERFEKGLAIKSDIKEFVENTRNCETFGLVSLTDDVCKKCKSSDEKAYNSCKLFNEFFK
jgi:ParB family chromosome partitioning protein